MNLFKEKDPMNDIPVSEEDSGLFSGRSGYFIFFGVLVFFVVFLGAAFLFFQSRHSTPPPPGDEQGQVATTAPPKLPGGGLAGSGDQGASSTLLATDVEKLSFGKYYQSLDQTIEPQIKSYDLPINVKVDVSNYYDISRKLDLDTHLDELNEYGFSIINADFVPAEAGNDFFSVYRYLLAKDVPVVITDDFLLYYFQNHLKQTYKDIEQEVFYRNLWDINEDLYNIALSRYRQSRLELGLVNDPVLEAQRLELAYLAVGLKLLSPTEEQVSSKADFQDNGKFSEAEASIYSFRMPEYLEQDVLEEVALVREGKGENKSPVLLYPRNYGNFSVPAGYQNNDKLGNFYLATKWLNSVFPLEYKTDECEHCLLDYNDWSINMIGAGYLSRDLYTNQDIKTRWAIIYKFISFFSGLRQDLTYLHYHEAYKELFGDDYDLGELFSDPVKRQENLEKVQSRIRDFSFLEAEGAISRDNSALRPRLGMRMLQEDYWPNDYIFNRLTGPDLTAATELARGRFSACRSREHALMYRCRGVGLDVVNLLDPFDLTSRYFIENADYTGYNSRSEELQAELDHFDKHTWNKNVYWATLDVGNKLLEPKNSAFPVFMRSSQWNNTKEAGTMLGAWVNLHLPDDNFLNYTSDSGSALDLQSGYDGYHFVEADPNLIRELISKNNMLLEMMAVLGVTADAKSATVRLQEVNRQLNRMADISGRILENKEMNQVDRKFLTDFAKRYIVEASGETEFCIDGSGDKSLEPGLGRNNILLLVYYYPAEDKLVLAAGPLFDYQENK